MRTRRQSIPNRLERRKHNRLCGACQRRLHPPGPAPLRRSGLGDSAAIAELLALLDGYPVGHVPPLLRAERDLARARLLAAAGDHAATSALAAAVDKLRLAISPYHLAHGLLDVAQQQMTDGELATSCYDAYVSVNVSVRLDDGLADRLRLRARAAGETLSDRLRRYAEEGTRRDEHPLITFRDGPTGRRAGLVVGPDIWEVAMWVEDLSAEPDPLAALIEDSILTRAQIDAALRYRVVYPDEIDARIELHRQETADAQTF